MKVNIFLLIFVLNHFGFAEETDEQLAQKHQQYLLSQKIDFLKTSYNDLKEVHRKAIESKWSVVSTQLEKKELIKSEMDGLRSDLEIVSNNSSRVQEEILIKEQALEDAKEKFREIEDEVSLQKQQVSEIVNHLKQKNRAGIPLGLEQRVIQVNKFEGEVKPTSTISKYFEASVGFYLQHIDNLSKIQIKKETIILSSGVPVEATVLSVGSGLVFAQDKLSKIYFLSKSSFHFEWNEILDEHVAEGYREIINQVLSTQFYKGVIPVDVLQDNNSTEILGFESKSIEDKIWKFLNDGGPLLIPLGLLLFWAFIIIIQKVWILYIRNSTGLTPYKGFLENTEKSIKSKGIHSSIIKGVQEAGVISKDQLEEVCGKVIQTSYLKLGLGMDSLSTIAGAAPLLGLLGTVTGMIQLFTTITRFGATDPKLMAGGISEALITTEAGLAVAIPLLLVHNAFKVRREALINSAEEGLLIILDDYEASFQPTES
jgi:biopolymer transport protein ExbB